MKYHRKDRKPGFRLAGNRQFRRQKIRARRADDTVFTKPSMFERVAKRRKKARSC